MKNLQFKINDIKKKISKFYVTGESGGGMVKITVNGNKEIIKIEIDDDIINLNDKEILQDLIISALNVSFKEINFKIKKEFSSKSNLVFSNLFLEFFF